MGHVPSRVMPALCFGAAMVLGCSGDARPISVTTGLEASERLVASDTRPITANGIDAPQLAMVDGRPLDTAVVTEMLSEAAGEEILTEAALDHLLRDQCATRGIALTHQEVEAEEARLRQSVARAASVEADATDRVIDAVRTRRKLGPVRYARLLERTAMLRKLSAADVASVDEPELRMAFNIRYGPRVRCRVLRADSALEVGAWVTQVRSAEHPELAFARLATEKSMDASAAAGGLLPAFSLDDPSYPAALRDAVKRLDVGEVSSVVAVDGGFAAAMVLELVPATGDSFETRRAELEQELTDQRTRAAMEAHSRRLLANARVQPATRSLQWAWRRRVERDVVP